MHLGGLSQTTTLVPDGIPGNDQPNIVPKYGHTYFIIQKEIFLKKFTVTTVAKSILFVILLSSTDEVGCVDPGECKKYCDNPVGCSNIAYPWLVMTLLPVGKTIKRSQIPKTKK